MNTKKTNLDRLTDKLENKYIGIEPMLLIGIIAILIIYYYIFSSLGDNSEGSVTSDIKSFFETILWLLFIVLLLLNGITYIFGIDTIKTIKNLFGQKDETSNNVVDEKDINIIIANIVFIKNIKNIIKRTSIPRAAK